MSFMFNLLRSAVDLTVYEKEEYPIYKINPIPKFIYFLWIFLIGLAFSSGWATPTAVKAGAVYQIFLLVGQIIFFAIVGRPILTQVKKNRFAITFIIVFIGGLNVILGGPLRYGWDVCWLWWPPAFDSMGNLLSCNDTAWFINISDLSIAYGISKTLFLINVMMAGIMLLKTTNPRALTTSLTDRGLPEKIAFFAGMTLRFIPLIADEMNTTLKAHMVRGLELQKGSFIQRIKSIGSVIPPMIIVVLRITDRMGTVYETRGYEIEKKTTIIDTKLKNIDRFLIILEVILIMFAIHILFTRGLEWIFSINIPFGHPMPDTLFWFLPPIYFDFGLFGLDWPQWIKDLLWLFLL